MLIGGKVDQADVVLHAVGVGVGGGQVRVGRFHHGGGGGVLGTREGGGEEERGEEGLW